NSSMISKSIERDQKKVEKNNFGIRKRLLEYDDVMNIQREAVYKKRDTALYGDRLSVDLYNMFDSLMETIVFTFKQSGDYESYRNECMSQLSVDPNVTEQEFSSLGSEQVLNRLEKQVFEVYELKKQHLRNVFMPIVENVYQNQGHRYKRILVPYHDGSMHPLPVSAELKKAVESAGESLSTDIEQAITLSLIDDKWKEHLRAMDELKDSVQSASFEQKDPLVIYKMEAYKLFENLIHTINREVVSYLMRGQLMVETGEQIREAKEQKTDLSNIQTNKEEEARKVAAQNAGARTERPVVEQIVRTEDKIGRNDLCPCGSGKKYKNCHG
nr:SEC-C domain-containing protein [Saprospiraceae bacterium]